MDTLWELMLLKAKSGAKNLLDYSDLVNKNYGGHESTSNVRTEGVIAVRPGASMILTGPEVSQLDIRFYDADGNYNNQKVTTYIDATVSVEFTVPDDCVSLRPKWYNSQGDLSVDDVIAGNPVIKYV